MASFCFPATSHAEGLGNQSSSVFRFQQKLADNGNPQAQYKLAMMYEAGVGTDKDIEQAGAKAQQERELDVATSRQANIEPAGDALDEKALAVRKEAEAARKAAQEKKLLAEKKRGYDKVMEQIRLEQKLIDEQQARVAGAATAAVDDEF
jgi:hypothetical protein